MESPLPLQSPANPSLRITALKPDDADLLPSPRAGAICRSSRTRSSGATAVFDAAPAKAPMAMFVGTDAFSFFFADMRRGSPALRRRGKVSRQHGAWLEHSENLNPQRKLVLLRSAVPAGRSRR